MGHLFLVTQAFLQWQRAGGSHGCLEPIITELGGICVRGSARNILSSVQPIQTLLCPGCLAGPVANMYAEFQ